MGRYNVCDVPIDQLWLDEKNPRFIIPPNPTQQSIVNYLLDYEEVEQLAKDIIIGGGLYAGERIIVIKESDKFIVVEGNRRVCACKILLHPELLSERRPATVDEIQLLIDTHKSAIDEIFTIPVDLMDNRLSAQSSLAAKHIDGIKKWSTLSKYKFITSEFDNGKGIDEISVVTGISKQKIRSGLKDYRIIQYVLELPLWTEQQKRDYLDLQEIKTTRLTRLFSAKTREPNRLRLRDVLKLSYDERYIIKTELKKEEFDNIIFMVAQAAFVPTEAVKNLVSIEVRLF